MRLPIGGSVGCCEMVSELAFLSLIQHYVDDWESPVEQGAVPLRWYLLIEGSLYGECWAGIEAICCPFSALQR